MSSLLACGHVHHHLVSEQKRTRVALIVESAEASLVHHFCLLVGYGADAICPYLAFKALAALQEDGRMAAQTIQDLRSTYIQVRHRFRSNRNSRKCCLRCLQCAAGSCPSRFLTSLDVSRQTQG